PGLVARVLVKEGDNVKAGDTVVVLNVMKTEINVQSERDGVVKEIKVKEWDEVDIGSELVVLDTRG
ncbi:MAG: biotin/lipoyl-containing protein, partial [Nitrososphaerota archaeon]